MTNTIFHNKKILITGARGFIGSHLCKRLEEFDVEIHAVSRTHPGVSSGRIRWWNGLMSDIECVRKLISSVKPDFIFHFSGFVSGLRDVNYVLEAYHSLLTSTVNILTVATEVGCSKVVLAGSMEEPDEKSGAPNSPYAAAKWACRGYARMFKELYGTPVINPRIFMAYGPGQREYRKLIPYVTLSLLRNQIPRLSSGSRAIDWVYIDDLIEGLIALLISNDVGDDSLDIGTGEPTTVKEIVDNLVEITDSSVKPMFGEMAERPMERVVTADINYMVEKTGWKPKISIRQGLMNTVKWYKENLDDIMREKNGQ